MIWYRCDMIKYDTIWKWQFSKKYQFKTDNDIIFIFKFQIKSVLIPDFSFCSHFISTKLETDSTFVISVLYQFNIQNTSFIPIQPVLAIKFWYDIYQYQFCNFKTWYDISRYQYCLCFLSCPCLLRTIRASRYRYCNNWCSWNFDLLVFKGMNFRFQSL